MNEWGKQLSLGLEAIHSDVLGLEAIYNGKLCYQGMLEMEMCLKSKEINGFKYKAVEEGINDGMRESQLNKEGIKVE